LPISSSTCATLTAQASAVVQAEKSVLFQDLPMNQPPIGAFNNLPSLCLKCHTQTQTDNKLYLPIQDLNVRVRNGDRLLAETLRSYITPNADGVSKMPLRTSGDDADYAAYLENDYPQLKNFVDDLLK
jgi:hypothetical protein